MRRGGGVGKSSNFAIQLVSENENGRRGGAHVATLPQGFVVHRHVRRDWRASEFSKKRNAYRKSALDANFEERFFDSYLDAPMPQTGSTQCRFSFSLRIVDRQRGRAPSEVCNLPRLDGDPCDDPGGEDYSDTGDEKRKDQSELDGCLTGFGVVTQVVQCAKSGCR